MLSNDFPLYTPGVRRLYHFEFHRDQHLLSAECRRTMGELADTAPRRVEKGQLTIAEVREQQALWLAIAEDLEAQDKWLAAGSGNSGWSLAERLRELRAANHVAWEEKVHALRQEIAARRAGYPGLVEKGMLTRDQAKTQLERLEAAHDLYWRHAFAFDLTREELRQHGSAITDRDVTECGPAKVPSTASSDELPEEGKKAA